MVILALLLGHAGFAYAALPLNAKVYFYLYDHLGGVDKMVDRDGNVVCSNDYLPYGSPRRTDCMENQDTEDPYGYTGKELDAETDLYYYGARYYDPGLGRFITQDPWGGDLADPQTLNGYSYVLNNPLRFTDSTGQYEEDVHYDLTYALGLFAGLPKGTARNIAYYNQAMDEDPNTAPADYHSLGGFVNLAKNYLSGTTGDQHFITREEAVNRLNTAAENKNSADFGSALHSFQDTYSHGEFYVKNKIINTIIGEKSANKYFAPAGHALEKHAPDKTYLRPGLANEMAKTTFGQLRQFNSTKFGTGAMNMQQYNQQTSQLWEQIAPAISAYNSLVNKFNTAISTFASMSKFSIRSTKN